MELNKEKIVIIILFSVVILAGVALFVQGNILRNMPVAPPTLQKEASVKSTLPPGVNSPDSEGNPLPDSRNIFIGKIISINADSMAAQIDIVDYNKPNNTDKSTGETSNNAGTNFQKTPKNVVVKINSATKFSNTKKDDFKVGDWVFVKADSSPLSSDAVTALQIDSLPNLQNK